MGILSENKHDTNILTENGFEFEQRNVTGELSRCYERGVRLSDAYYAWVGVDIKTGEIITYIEYECGGEVAHYDYKIDTSFDEHPQKFFEELDELITRYAETFGD